MVVLRLAEKLVKKKKVRIFLYQAGDRMLYSSQEKFRFALKNRRTGSNASIQNVEQCPDERSILGISSTFV